MRMKGDYYIKMFMFIDKKKFKYYIRLKCICKELNQMRKYKNNYIYMYVNVFFLIYFIFYIKLVI